MAITRDTINRLMIDENQNITIIRVVRYLDDGTLIGERTMRRVVTRDDDISGEPAKIRQIAAVVWS